MRHHTNMLHEYAEKIGQLRGVQLIQGVAYTLHLCGFSAAAVRSNERHLEHLTVRLQRAWCALNHPLLQ